MFDLKEIVENPPLTMCVLEAMIYYCGKQVYINKYCSEDEKDELLWDYMMLQEHGPYSTKGSHWYEVIVYDKAIIIMNSMFSPAYCQYGHRRTNWRKNVLNSDGKDLLQQMFRLNETS